MQVPRKGPRTIHKGRGRKPGCTEGGSEAEAGSIAAGGGKAVQAQGGAGKRREGEVARGGKCGGGGCLHACARTMRRGGEVAGCGKYGGDLNDCPRTKTHKGQADEGGEGARPAPRHAHQCEGVPRRQPRKKGPQ